MRVSTHGCIHMSDIGYILTDDTTKGGHLHISAYALFLNFFFSSLEMPRAFPCRSLGGDDGGCTTCATSASPLTHVASGGLVDPSFSTL